MTTSLFIASSGKRPQLRVLRNQPELQLGYRASHAFNTNCINRTLLKKKIINQKKKLLTRERPTRSSRLHDQARKMAAVELFDTVLLWAENVSFLYG